MQLKAIKSGGILKWTGLEEDFASELALDLDEEIDNVKITLNYQLSCVLAETSDGTNFFFPYAVANTGSETSAAKRMRDMRVRNNVTQALRDSYGDKEEDKEKDIDIDSDAEADIEGDYKGDAPPNKDVEEMIKRVHESCRRLGIAKG